MRIVIRGKFILQTINQTDAPLRPLLALYIQTVSFRPLCARCQFISFNRLETPRRHTHPRARVTTRVRDNGYEYARTVGYARTVVNERDERLERNFNSNPKKWQTKKNREA